MEDIRVVKQQASPNDASQSSSSLTFVTMNIAGCVPSQMAPDSWTQKDSIEAIRNEIISRNPDIIALQESPGGVEWVGPIFDGYKALGATYTHADQVVLLVKNEIKAILIPMAGLPVVMAELEFETSRRGRLLVASVHLQPWKTGDGRRKKQMEAIVEAAKSRSLPVVIAGDTNMRQTEDSIMEGDLGLLDVWKLAGSNPSTQFTWDTVDYRSTFFAGLWQYFVGSETTEVYFNQYYGQDTRQYTARYDRIYIYNTNDSIEIKATDETLKVTFDLIANKPMTSDLDFLSDHFGVVSNIPIYWKSLI